VRFYFKHYLEKENHLGKYFHDDYEEKSQRLTERCDTVEDEIERSRAKAWNAVVSAEAG